MRRLLFAALALLAAPAAAQVGSGVFFPAGPAPGSSPCVKQADGTCVPVSATNPLPVDTVTRSTATDRGGLFGTTAAQLMPANAARRGIHLQNQSTSASCWISGQATATADWHSLLIGPGVFYESAPTHVGTGAISIICSAANVPFYAREF